MILISYKVKLTSIKAEILYRFITKNDRFPMVYKTTQTNLNILYKMSEMFMKQIEQKKISIKNLIFSGITGDNSPSFCTVSINNLLSLLSVKSPDFTVILFIVLLLFAFLSLRLGHHIIGEKRVCEKEISQTLTDPQ